MGLKEKLWVYWMAWKNWVNCLSIFIYEIFIFGKFIWFWKIKIYLWSYYLFNSPYKIVARAYKKIGIPYDNLIYGETPFVTMRHILEKINSQPGMKFCDLGSGRGITLFLAHCYFKMDAMGFEIIPDYVNISNKIRQKMKLEEVKCLNGNFFEFDLSGFDIIYVPASTWDEASLNKLKEKLKGVKVGSDIISITVPLKYDFLREVESCVYPFSWGTSMVYFYQRKD